MQSSRPFALSSARFIVPTPVLLQQVAARIGVPDDISFASHYSAYLKPEEAPKAIKHCPRCECDRPFESSDKFRINGHHKHLDVWLIYRCSHCEYTWNFTIFERTSPGDLPKGMLSLFEANDAALAWRFAFDYPRLKRAGVQEFASPSYECFVRQDVSFGLEGATEDAWDVLLLRSPHPLGVRLGAILSRVTNLSRSQVAKAFAEGKLLLDSNAKKPLRKPLVGEQLCFLPKGNVLPSSPGTGR